MVPLKTGETHASSLDGTKGSSANWVEKWQMAMRGQYLVSVSHVEELRCLLRLVHEQLVAKAI